MRCLKKFLILSIVIITACNNGINSDDNSRSVLTESSNSQDTSGSGEVNKEDVINSEMANESINEFIVLLNNIIYEEDLNKFIKFIDEFGLYSVSYFDDSRDKNKAILVFKEEDIREDLFLTSSQSGRAGISLSGGAFSTEVKDVHFNDFEAHDNNLVNVNWKVTDENIIQNQLPDILDGLRELILKNNKNIPQVFKLSETTYAFSYSDINEKALEKFYGYWVIFEDTGDTYTIRAFIELQ